MDEIKVFIYRDDKRGAQAIRKYIPGQNIPTSNPHYKNLIFVEELGEADYMVIIDNPPVANFPSEKKMYYKAEPDEFWFASKYWEPEYVDKEKSHFFTIDENTPRIQSWDIGKNYDYLNKHNPVTWDKKWAMQVVTTNYGDGTQQEQQLSGHIMRMKFLRKFLNEYGQLNEWRLWGRRLQNYNYPVNYGECHDKWDILYDSEYTFAFMNSNQNGFFDEKVIDPILCGCMPIVWGCPNLEKFLPMGSFIRLDITSETAVKDAWDIIHSSYREMNLDDLNQARNMILDRLSICPRLYKDINNIENGCESAKTADISTSVK